MSVWLIDLQINCLSHSSLALRLFQAGHYSTALKTNSRHLKILQAQAPHFTLALLSCQSDQFGLSLDSSSRLVQLLQRISSSYSECCSILEPTFGMGGKCLTQNLSFCFRLDTWREQSQTQNCGHDVRLVSAFPKSGCTSKSEHRSRSYGQNSESACFGASILNLPSLTAFKKHSRLPWLNPRSEPQAAALPKR